MALADRHDKIYPASELWIALRTAWIDERIRRLCKPNGNRAQVVLLGAGLDTRSARLAGDGLRWFEVDHPASQRLKRERLSGLQGYPVDTATFVRCDFEKDDFIDRLTEAGFDTKEPALFIWEGVTPYLSEGAVRGTVHRIASSCHPDTVLIYDHLEKKLVRGTNVDSADAALNEMVDELGEPFVFGIDDPLPLMVDEGYRQVRRVSFDEICLALTGTYERSRKFRFQHIVEASKNQLHTSW
jgi:methyltransferase (TIGR00027 family)